MTAALTRAAMKMDRRRDFTGRLGFHVFTDLFSEQQRVLARANAFLAAR
jgi:hypothetical protein